MKHKGTQATDPMKETKTSKEEDPRQANKEAAMTTEHRNKFL